VPDHSADTQAPTIVVTRPVPDHRGLIDRIQRLGLETLHCPMVRVDPEPEALRAKRLMVLAIAERVIVTSPAAARILLDSSVPEIKKSCIWLAPGAGTANVLAQASRPTYFPGRGATSEELLRMPALIEVSGLDIVIIGAPGGRELLADSLRQRGARVEFVHLYHRVPLDPAPELLARIDSGTRLVFLISSAQVLRAIAQRLRGPRRRHWQRSTFVVSSQRLAQHCRSLGIEEAHVAEGADDAAMLAALQSL